MIVSGALVFAKVRGHYPFPARVIKAGGSSFRVVFFATGEENSIKKENIWIYSLEKEEQLKKEHAHKKDFSEALEELKKCHVIENTMEILGGGESFQVFPQPTPTVRSIELEEQDEALGNASYASRNLNSSTDDTVMSEDSPPDLARKHMDNFLTSTVSNLTAPLDVSTHGPSMNNSLGGLQLEMDQSIIATDGGDITFIEHGETDKDESPDVTLKNDPLLISMGENSSANAPNSLSPEKEKRLSYKLPPDFVQALVDKANYDAKQKTSSKVKDYSADQLVEDEDKQVESRSEAKSKIKFKLNKKRTVSCSSQSVDENNDDNLDSDEEEKVKSNKIRLIKEKYSKKKTEGGEKFKKCLVSKKKKMLKRQCPSGNPLLDINNMIRETNYPDLSDEPNKKKIKKEGKEKEGKEKEGKEKESKKGSKATDRKLKKPDNVWLMFFNDNVERIKNENPGILYRDISQLLSKDWDELKITNPEKVEKYTQIYKQNLKEYELRKNAESQNKENSPQNDLNNEISVLKKEMDDTNENLREVTKENKDLKEEIKNVKMNKEKEINDLKNEKNKQTIAFMQCKQMLEKKMKECDSLKIQLKKNEEKSSSAGQKKANSKK